MRVKRVFGEGKEGEWRRIMILGWGGVKKKEKAEVSGDKRAGDPEVKLPSVHSHWTGVVAE